jgi:imidazolonepropionase-like amidohydrolase
MPMIIDTHTHLSQTREMLINDLTRRAYYGVSAALSLGQDTTDVSFQIRAETAAGKIPGAARFFTAGRGITGVEPGRTMAPHWVKSPAEARAAVDEEAAKKVDIVKIWVDDRMGTVTKLTPDIYGAAIDEAHKKGLRTITHIYTLGFLRDGMSAADFAKIDAANKDDAKAHEFWSIQARNLAKLNAAGIKIVLGTDGNTPYAPHVEMEDMVAAGMTPAQVIVASTRNAAEVLGLTDLGTIAAGKSADFIVLDANPLVDITNTRRIAMVYLRGTAVDRAALRNRWMGGKSE